SQAKVDLTMLYGKEIYKSTNFPVSINTCLKYEEFKMGLNSNITSNFTAMKTVG
ncbi:MAG: hypothetical protein ACI8SA_001750, partial [Dokdonia sp.]